MASIDNQPHTIKRKVPIQLKKQNKIELQKSSDNQTNYVR